MKKLFAYFLAATAGGFLALGTHQALMGGRLDGSATQPSAERAIVTPVGQTHRMAGMESLTDFTTAAERTVNAVVHVTTEAMVQQRDPFREFFWGYRPAPSQPLRGAGSGVIIAPDGYIVTNNHVVEGADKIMVHLNDNRTFEARIVGRDPSTDIALLKVDAQDLDVLPFGDSDHVRVGEWVLAVGNPMNLTSTVTAGIVSAKARNIRLLQYDPARDIFPIESFIQTDAAVNPGNSGGALVNTVGELIGINTAIASNTGQYAGYSFAVPANIVKKITSDLLEFGSVQRAYIGVVIENVDQEVAKRSGMDRIRGVHIKGITEGGAAQSAGMKEGDIILKVGSIDVNTVPQLQEQVSKFRPGDQVTVTIVREGRERVMDMKLKGRDGNGQLASGPRRDLLHLLGAQLAAANQDELRALKLEHGVKVVAIDSGKLRSSGIREGFIITRIDQQRIARPEDIEKALLNKKGGVLIEGVYPNGMKAYYGLGL